MTSVEELRNAENLLADFVAGIRWFSLGAAGRLTLKTALGTQLLVERERA